jgi:hypothetical protein
VNNKQFLGAALTFQAGWQAKPNLSVDAAFVRFIAGFLRAVGAMSVTWTSAWATFNF